MRTSWARVNPLGVGTIDLKTLGDVANLLRAAGRALLIQPVSLTAMVGTYPSRSRAQCWRC